MAEEDPEPQPEGLNQGGEANVGSAGIRLPAIVRAFGA